ncbi:putative N-acetyltransferase [Paramyrothecium foliicola]|nr:putative N-acetyltransferase [Paramyrothecium foliicola]
MGSVSATDKEQQASAPKRATRSRPALISPIETANKKNDEEFITLYMRPSAEWTQWTHPVAGTKYSLGLKQPGALSEEEAEECFRLVEKTSGDDYRSSSVGWHPAVKRKEMRSPDLRYLVVKDGDGKLKGFTSMMPTFENGEPVVYCYEIHLEPELQRTGLGKQLMQHVMDVAENVPSVRKTMLTCFLSNLNGRNFYEKMGFVTDPSSPGERKLRGGKVVKPDYVILSRMTARSRRGTLRDS